LNDLKVTHAGGDLRENGERQDKRAIKTTRIRVHDIHSVL
jgi:hypothetical protein